MRIFEIGLLALVDREIVETLILPFAYVLPFFASHRALATRSPEEGAIKGRTPRTKNFRDVFAIQRIARMGPCTGCGDHRCGPIHRDDRLICYDPRTRQARPSDNCRYAH